MDLITQVEDFDGYAECIIRVKVNDCLVEIPMTDVFFGSRDNNKMYFGNPENVEVAK